ncbi:MAG: DNA cytosine methyltransferase, partial [Candidatus Poribacteria bacterium]|nr:DNA cytosine methyltransferase [Candidatus Poribacteria bacterium]
MNSKSIAPETEIRASISAVDLFCGVGGMTYGLEQAGVKVNAGIDVDKTCKYAYQHNNRARFIEQDVRFITNAELAALYP